MSELPAPPYRQRDGEAVGLAVEDMKRHMTDEGWQLFAGLEHAGYKLAGYKLPYGETDVRKIVEQCEPRTLVLQDKREWTNRTADRRQDPGYTFQNVTYLAERNDVFKLTVLKDAQNDNGFHRESADEMGCHAWIVYYHPDTVHRLAPFTRRKHLIRTYHTVNRDQVPPYSNKDRAECILSGAMNKRVYPLRSRFMGYSRFLPGVVPHRHPGYHRRGAQTPIFLNTLSHYRVAICTSSIYGYALRKIIEATACGCMVITDLPDTDCLPMIDGNLVRVSPRISFVQMRDLLLNLYNTYDPERQRHYAEAACVFYDYRNMGKRLTLEIELMRKQYAAL